MEQKHEIHRLEERALGNELSFTSILPMKFVGEFGNSAVVHLVEVISFEYIIIPIKMLFRKMLPLWIRNKANDTMSRTSGPATREMIIFEAFILFNTRQYDNVTFPDLE